MARILITGASGLLGAALSAEAAPVHAVTRVCHHHPTLYPGTEMVQADLTQAGELDYVLDEAKPAWVVHCAAATDVDRCETDPDWARVLNRDLPRALAGKLHAIGAKLVHISTDAVFNGEAGPYGEHDRPDPVNVYAQTKWEAELAVAEALPSSLIVRTNFYGWNVQPKLSLAEWFLQRLRTGVPCPGFVDVTAAPLLANDLARILLEMVERGCSGLYHVASRECVSKFEFGRRVAATFGLDPDGIQPVRVAEAGLGARRPKQLCLRTDKAEAELGRRLPDIQDGLVKFRALAETKYAEKFRPVTPSPERPRGAA